MRKILILLCVLLASPAAAQIQKVQGVAGGYPVPVSVSGGSFPVPTGGATSAKQDQQITLATAGNVSLSSIDATLLLLNAKFGSLGQKTAAGSAPVVLASDQTLPLPTGAATETTLGTRASAANQTNGSQKTQVVDAGGNVQPAGDSTARPIYVLGTGAAANGAAASGNPVLVGGSDGTNARTLVMSNADSTSGYGQVVRPINVPGSSASLSAVSLTTTGTSVFSSTAAVKSRKIYNRANNPIVYCVYYSGTNVTSEATASFAIMPGQTWEMPTFSGVVEFTGQINCATASSTGSIQATQVL
jgi:hypothetical protein